MGAPKAVQDQIDLAEKIQKELTQPEQDAKPEPGKEVVDDPKPDADKPVTADSENGAKTAEKDQQKDEKPKTEESEADLLRKRLASFKKMYDTNISKLRKENESLTSETESLKAKVSELEQQIAQSSESNKDLTEKYAKLTKEFGPDLVDGVLEIVKDNTPEQVETQVDTKTEIQDTTDKTQSNNSEASDFWSSLEDMVPNWESINDSTDFKKFLAQRDFSGKSRQNYLDAAQKREDAFAVAQIFHEFEDLSRSVTQEQHKEDVLPDEKGGGFSPEAEVIITAKEVEEFYRDNSLGKLEPAYAAQREAEINLAMSEGRIR